MRRAAPKPPPAQLCWDPSTRIVRGRVVVVEVGVDVADTIAVEVDDEVDDEVDEELEVALPADWLPHAARSAPAASSEATVAR